MFKRLLRRNTDKLWLYIWISSIILTVLYFEVYLYYSNSRKWHSIKCQNEGSCTKILLVADPQIIGKQNEIFHFLTPLSIYDSDRYLKQTYSYAFDFAKPDLVIFLGDLMDEGSTATNKEFNGYVRRLFSIFVGNTFSNIRHIWLPGDNDIGGEGSERVTPDKIKRFNRAFSQPDLIYLRNLTFLKINRMIQSIPKISENREFYDSSKIFIGLSHLPLMFMPSLFVDKILAKVQPQLLFTAHEHKSMIISTNALIREDRQIVPVTPDNNNKVFHYNLGVSDMYEIIVPTCSYRMGTDKIGYGYGIIEKNELYYTVLWSPSRFPQLLVYVMVFAISLTYFVLHYVIRTFKNKHYNYKLLSNA